MQKKKKIETAVDIWKGIWNEFMVEIEIVENTGVLTKMCRGGDLETLIKKKEKEKGCFSEQEMLKIVWCVMNGLKAMHEKNIVHNNVKASNILIAEDGNFILDCSISEKRVTLNTEIETDIPRMLESVAEKGSTLFALDLRSFACIVHAMIRVSGEALNVSRRFNNFFKSLYSGTDYFSAGDVLECDVIVEAHSLALVEEKMRMMMMTELEEQRKNMMKRMEEQRRAMEEQVEKIRNENLKLKKKLRILEMEKAGGVTTSLSPAGPGFVDTSSPPSTPGVQYLQTSHHSSQIHHNSVPSPLSPSSLRSSSSHSPSKPSTPSSLSSLFAKFTGSGAGAAPIFRPLYPHDFRRATHSQIRHTPTGKHFPPFAKRLSASSSSSTSCPSSTTASTSSTTSSSCSPTAATSLSTIPSSPTSPLRPSSAISSAILQVVGEPAAKSAPL